MKEVGQLITAIGSLILWIGLTGILAIIAYGVLSNL